MHGYDEDFWVVRTIKSDGTYGREGLVPSAYLEKEDEDFDALSVALSSTKDDAGKEPETLNLTEYVF